MNPHHLVFLLCLIVFLVWCLKEQYDVPKYRRKQSDLKLTPLAKTIMALLVIAGMALLAELIFN